MVSNNPQGRRVIVSRRRRPDAVPAGGRERAQTPRRWGASGGTGGIPSSSGGGGDMSGIPTSSGGGGSPLPFGGGCMSIAGIIIFVILLLLVFGLFICQGGSGIDIFPSDTGTSDTTSYDTSYSPQIADQPTAANFVTNYPPISSSSVQSPSKAGQTWLVMLYQDADDRLLEKDICLDLNEAEKAGSSNRVKIVAQMDRYNGGVQRGW